jgi:hypothetical protein
VWLDGAKYEGEWS